MRKDHIVEKPRFKVGDIVVKNDGTKYGRVVASAVTSYGNEVIQLHHAPPDFTNSRRDSVEDAPQLAFMFGLVTPYAEMKEIA